MNLGKVVLQGKSQANSGRMKNDGLVKPALVGWLRSKYGENSPIANIKDARILSMRDALKEKKENFDAESILG